MQDVWWYVPEEERQGVTINRSNWKLSAGLWVAEPDSFVGGTRAGVPFAAGCPACAAMRGADWNVLSIAGQMPMSEAGTLDPVSASRVETFKSFLISPVPS